MAAPPVTNHPVPTRSYNLDKLVGPNYLVWRVRMEMLLKRTDLWAIVSGTELDPGPTDAAAQILWQKKDLAAQMEVVVHLGDRQVQMVRTLATSKAVWDLLQENYEHKDLVSQVSLMKNLSSQAMQEGQSAASFLDQWHKLLDDAAISGLVIPETLQAMMLLTALPPTWRAFITTQSTTANLTVQSLSARILQEDGMRSTTGTASKPIAMQASLRPFNRGPQNRQSFSQQQQQATKPFRPPRSHPWHSRWK